MSNTLSSDLLQILQKEPCPPGLSAEDIIQTMEQNGQIRKDSAGVWSVHVTVKLDKNQTSAEILQYLSEPIEDASYHLITGWVTAQNLTKLSALDGVLRITPVFPPAGSGSLELAQDQEQNKSSDITWKNRLSTDLLQLFDDAYLSPGQTKADIIALLEKTGEARISGNNLEVQVSAKVKSSLSPRQFEDFFTSPVADMTYSRISGWIGIENISRLAMQEGIVSLAVQIPPRTSEIRTEGDFILQTKDFREKTGLSGEGVKIGVISDGVDGLDELIRIGELPNITVLSNTIGGDEGLAMLQIIHDIAPNATLFFHDRGTSQIAYVRALDQLITHGCSIICDDITYVEPFFEDGYISQNIIDRILSYHILYITAAGNFAQEHYQAPFSGYKDQGYQWHNFNGSSGPDLTFTVPSGVAGHVILQWDDRFGASANNYDLFLYDESGREIARSVNLQDGDDDPMEWVRFVNSLDRPQQYTVRVVQAAAEDAMLEIYVLPLSGRSIVLDPCTPEDSVFGQQAIQQALVVGAAALDGKNLTAQKYSSHGPALIRYPSFELRQKPDVVAPDHITVLTGSMEHAVFTGTSAAAPHIAALAALIMSGSPGIPGSEVRKIILNATGRTEKDWNNSIGLGMPAGINISLPNSTLLPPVTEYKVFQGCKFEPREMEQADCISLYPGWNMISIPYPLAAGNDTAAIFSGVDTAAHSIWRYNSDKKSWSPATKNSPLIQMDVIWIYALSKTTVTLHFDSNGVNQTTKHLYPGWNPVGVPGLKSITAQDLLSPLADAWTAVLVFDSKTQEYRPSIINGGSGTYSPSRLLYPSEGWWIYMNQPGILFPSC